MAQYHDAADGEVRKRFGRAGIPEPKPAWEKRAAGNRLWYWQHARRIRREFRLTLPQQDGGMCQVYVRMHIGECSLARLSATVRNRMMIPRRSVRRMVPDVLPLRVTRIAKLLDAVLDQAREQTVRFDDLSRLLRVLGFEQRRVRGSHHVFTRPGVPEILNLQPRTSGMAKPYQVRQCRRVILRYGLHLKL